MSRPELQAPPEIVRSLTVIAGLALMEDIIVLRGCRGFEIHE